MTEQNLAALQVETITQGGDQAIAFVAVESLLQGNPGQNLAALDVEALVKATPKQQFAFLGVETLLKLGGFPPQGPIPNTARPNVVPCNPPPTSRFRKFWTTQPDACPQQPGIPVCGEEVNCGRPGLTLNKMYDPNWQMLACAQDGGGGLPDCPAPVVGATIANNDYVRGLVLNILGTNAAQAAVRCGQRPGQRQGYWLDDITGNSVGTSIRYVPTSGFSVNQQVAFIQMQAQSDMQKLVTYGVCNSVTVSATYIGNSSVSLTITVYGENDEMTVVNSTVTKLANSWVWNN